jgi:hypothetical protein
LAAYLQESGRHLITVLGRHKEGAKAILFREAIVLLRPDHGEVSHVVLVGYQSYHWHLSSSAHESLAD